ncbi:MULTISPECIES: anti-virulence regulator CigR family protein [unclassified Pseudomonas]|uniref:anti-virulence regulator CigR family protein n=1 Tax=unclassified Pseudomonas TaxID=196821 RepID=UPI000DAE7140|nr:anti-virulence regulator CigR family protein [Pseudomonas sp. URMO17WK12:I2]PZW46129.1 nickel/cobalt transporter regulator [Pseudomonas sp. URMO17WK12:I2]
MASSRLLMTAVVSIAMAIGPCLAAADPGNGKGHGQGNGKAQAQPFQGPGKQRGGSKEGGRHTGPSIDRGGILSILQGNRSYWSPAPTLPPGIQKNLARGKPLPPGIAKKLDGRLLGQLPRYDGYEWMQAGVDLILVAVATGVIYEVLSGALD